MSVFFEKGPQRFHRKTGTLRYRHGKIRPEALDTFKAEIVKHFMQPAEGVRRVRKLLTDRAQAVVSQPYTAYSFTLKRLVKSLYGKSPTKAKSATKAKICAIAARALMQLQTAF